MPFNDLNQHFHLGFDSVGGSGNGSTKSDDGVGGGVHHPHSRKHDQHLGVHHHNNPNDRQFHMSNNYVRMLVTPLLDKPTFEIL